MSIHGLRMSPVIVTGGPLDMEIPRKLFGKFQIGVHGLTLVCIRQRATGRHYDPDL